MIEFVENEDLSQHYFYFSRNTMELIGRIRVEQSNEKADFIRISQNKALLGDGRRSARDPISMPELRAGSPSDHPLVQGERAHDLPGCRFRGFRDKCRNDLN
jgi:hypothetical protein